MFLYKKIVFSLSFQLLYNAGIKFHIKLEKPPYQKETCYPFLVNFSNFTLPFSSLQCARFCSIVFRGTQEKAKVLCIYSNYLHFELFLTNYSANDFFVCCYYISALLLACFRLKKGRATYF